MSSPGLAWRSPRACWGAMAAAARGGDPAARGGAGAGASAALRLWWLGGGSGTRPRYSWGSAGVSRARTA